MIRLESRLPISRSQPLIATTGGHGLPGEGNSARPRETCYAKRKSELAEAERRRAAARNNAVAKAVRRDARVPLGLARLVRTVICFSRMLERR